MAQKQIIHNGTSLSISYEIIGNGKEKTILFLHRWGANKNLMKQAFGNYLEDFTHIYMDLPGFGNSTINSPLCSNDYKEIVKNFLISANLKIDIIVGHSFGGKIGTLLNPNKLVLLSSAGIVPEKRLFIKLKIKLFKAFKKLGFGFLYKHFATNDVKNMDKIMYETLKKVVDEKLNETFRKFKGQALIFWGKNDTATPLKSGEIIHSLIENSEFLQLEGDHFFFLHHNDFIAKNIGEKLC